MAPDAKTELACHAHTGAAVRQGNAVHAGRSVCANAAAIAGLLLVTTFSTYWFLWFGMRAEIRTLDFTAEAGGLHKHEASSLWMRIECPDWDDAYTGSKQPVPCTVKWMSEPGMVMAGVGWLFVIVGVVTWLAQACCFRRSTHGRTHHAAATTHDATSDAEAAGTTPCLQDTAATKMGTAAAAARSNWCLGSRLRLADALVFAGSAAMFLAWVMVASDDSRLNTLSHQAWYGSLCGPMYFGSALLKTCMFSAGHRRGDAGRTLTSVAAV